MSLTLVFCCLVVKKSLIRIVDYGTRVLERRRQEMKTKLTLTIDEDLIPQAKRYAEARRDSLSGLVEKALQDLTQTQEIPFSKRWRGKFKASRRASTRYKALSWRYL